MAESAKRVHHCLIDGSGFMHRAKAMATPRAHVLDGMEVGVAALFARMMAKVARRACEGKVPPTHWMVAFDPPRSDSWRREMCAAYKAHRPETEEVFKAQIPLMKEACRAAGLAVVEAPRHEADDLLAAYAHDAAVSGARVTIVSSDKDLMQLVRPGVWLWDARADLWFNEALVVEKFGVPPARLGDYLALAGDVADGIPGARGIGPKMARAMLQEGRTLSEMLDNPSVLSKPRWRELVEANIEPLRLARLLVALDIGGCPRPVREEAMYTPSPGLISSRFHTWMSTL